MFDGPTGPAPDLAAPYDHPEAHRFRIGLAPIPVDRWFEAPYGPKDGVPAERKAAVFAARPDLCWAETDGSREAQGEALAMIEAHLGRSAPDNATAPPLRRAALLVDDDLCLMQRRGVGWTLTAASLCAPSFFSAREAVGKALGELHQPVTGFAEQMAGRVVRIFDSLPADQIVERRNWTVTATGDLFTPDAAPMRARLPLIAPDDAGRALFLRMERQTLRRLPATGALLFTIRVWRHPLETLRAQPARLAAFAHAWDRVMSEAGRDFRNYKGLAPIDPLVRAFLRDA